MTKQPNVSKIAQEKTQETDRHAENHSFREIP